VANAEKTLFFLLKKQPGQPVSGIPFQKNYFILKSQIVISKKVSQNAIPQNEKSYGKIN
jgi:hypothetical protein